MLYCEAPVCCSPTGTRIHFSVPHILDLPHKMQDHVGGHLPHVIRVMVGQTRPHHPHHCIQIRQQVEAGGLPSPDLRKDTQKRD